jgi:hypothetical protein
MVACHFFTGFVKQYAYPRKIVELALKKEAHNTHHSS